MKVYLKEIKFPSTKHTAFFNITKDVKDAVKKVGTEVGIVVVSSKHTTLGVVVQEISEPNLLQDILDFALTATPEDKRSTKVTKDYKYPTRDFLHRCQDNPFCNEIDEDYNAASHIRALLYSHPSVVLPIREGKLELGKYQEIAALEFDGRDGKGKNPIRQRTIQVWIFPAEEIIEI
ncbi:hypothetical protein A3E45_02345 [Candidatus Daviesbacteria bacterium RIFCSPHIGHO2_12_FULL_43_11]|uniref:Secondary thiamine-phosphate synthase enzyme n=1 Tax=Candidatus Daviesbacteria bacterium RIFCSPHIGHO2_12_FULL_43_11 TaxID=1797780 RepID=A0A1F5K1M3_9BACT|nr:MAG: hypothetical protein A2874_02575 [Candidatus Daviesbacteria bacterium RIFCSPHIGHO2_01_FULL_43_17]OGE34794.1 MAG: hypothetical protein A3E45_02345 [Candidatus Daviesbacteria bacterium RIFCSPHIGHO2_12_FULL_43_11]OGE70607.1 MAG: hypothetical protein A3J21_00390 [Candidatus Daviesbacteria bacterium RIFCSPLOWO2_02_FULL_43_11]